MPDARGELEKVRWWTVVRRNGPPQARRALGEGEMAVGMHQTQDMIRKEHPAGQGTEDAWGGAGSSRRGRYASGVKVVFTDEWLSGKEYAMNPANPEEENDMKQSWDAQASQVLGMPRDPIHKIHA